MIISKNIPETLSILSAPTHWTATRSSFFKFMTRSTGRIVLNSSTIRWSRPALLNDPHDNQFHLLPTFDRGEARRVGLERLWESHYSTVPLDEKNELGRLIAANRGRFPMMSRSEFVETFAEGFNDAFEAVDSTIAEFNDDIQAQMAENKLLCLTESADDTRMWAHYAEGHKGIALRFRAIPELDSVWGLAEPVRYQETLPPLLDIDYFADIMSGRRSLDVSHVLRSIVFIKSAAWAYEREWRLYGGAGRNPSEEFEDVPFSPHELDAVIFGCKTPKDDIQQITALVRNKYASATIYSAIADRDSFDISFEIMP